MLYQDSNGKVTKETPSEKAIEDAFQICFAGKGKDTVNNRLREMKKKNVPLDVMSKLRILAMRKGLISGLFPWKLHCLLENNDYQEIISWLPGNKFKVHDRKAFVKHIMPDHLGFTTFNSFQSNLSHLGFMRVKTGSDKGAYHHKFFVREKPWLCEKIGRVKRN